MNEIEVLARMIDAQLNAGSPVVLVSIMDLQGSTPRHDGAKMAVGADGKCYGTIGGSLIEAAAIKESKTVLAKKKSKVFSHDLTGKDASSPGMICGGKAEILLDYLAPTAENKEFARCLSEAVRQGRDFYLLTHLQGEGSTFKVLGHAIMDASGNLYSASSLTPPDADKLKPDLHNVSTTAVMPLAEGRVMVDRIRKVKTIYCFGGGHVALPTAHLASLVGFRVVIIDDRPEYANAERFPEAQACIVSDFTSPLDGLDIDADSYIVIVTRGHQYDRVVLEAALKTTAGYIGMISSRRKKEAVYQVLLAEGVKQERLNFVHSPIGIDIGGETPEEIAVSIVAELIAERNRQSG
jgi:xanthine dehydrogenase accessory factor